MMQQRARVKLRGASRARASRAAAAGKGGEEKGSVGWLMGKCCLEMRRVHAHCLGRRLFRRARQEVVLSSGGKQC